jgi:hypothetical protein
VIKIIRKLKLRIALNVLSHVLHEEIMKRRNEGAPYILRLYTRLLSEYIGREIDSHYHLYGEIVRRGGYCLCRFKTPCPCTYHIKELEKYGRCRCGLFVVIK